MQKEDFLKLGLTEDQAAKAAVASAEELKGFVPKARFDEVNAAKTALEGQVKEHGKQLETLKKSTGDVESLKTQIGTLQEENKKTKTEYDAKIKDMQISSAIKLAVADSAQDVDLVAGLFDRSKLILGEDGKITGLDEQLKTLKEGKAFLFKGSNPKPGYTPAGGDPAAKNPFAKETFNLTEQGKLLKENPAQAKVLAAAAGVTIQEGV